MKRVIFLGLLAIVSTALLDAQTGVLPGPTRTPRAAPTGFYGQSLYFYSGGAFQPPQEGIPYRTYVSVYDSDGKLLKRLVSNPAGQFYSPIKPGNYVLLATAPAQKRPPRNLSEYSPPALVFGLPAAPLVNITVSTNQLTRADVVYYSRTE